MGKNSPLISIVIPVYNSEKILPKALDSLVNQTYKALEIIVINNGSSGNVEEIFKKYKEVYPELKWVLYTFKENVGIFPAEIKGFSIMTGDYFTVLDSDDYLSIDYCYQLLRKAMEDDADIVSTEFVHEYVGGAGCMREVLNETEYCDFCWEKEDVLKKYIEYQDRFYNCGTVWSKLFARELWEKSKSFLEPIQDKMLVCWDVFCNLVFAFYAKKWTNIHGVRYYHTVHSTNISTGRDKENCKGILTGTYDAFRHMERFLVSVSVWQYVEDDFISFKRRMAASAFGAILFAGGLSECDKEGLYRYGCKLFDYEKPIFLSDEQCFVGSRTSPLNNGLEEARRQLLSKDIQVVSFDVFDTLIERPFLHPDDTFDFLSIQYNELHKSAKYIDFGTYRRIAEQAVREKVLGKHPFYQDVTLDEIYEELCYENVLTEEEADRFKRLEIELEYRFCKARKIGRELYDVAVRGGKQIVCISDMYLPREVIRNILTKNGYTEVSAVYVSSEDRVCKHSGKLFRKALSDLRIRPEVVCHIGDNEVSDISAAQALGIRTIYLASAREMLMGNNRHSYSGRSFPHIMGEDYDVSGFTGYLGNRCMAGMIANKVFSDPFVTFHPDSDFDCNPRIIGYYLLGSYIFAVAKWLLEKTSEKEYETIHFIARDGYICKQAYDILASHSKRRCPKSNYLYASRSAMAPLMIKTKADLLSIREMINVFAFTPDSFLKKVRQIIPDSAYQDREKILLQNRIDPDAYFENSRQWDEFMGVYARFFFDDKKIGEYQNHFKRAFGNIVGHHDCTFDVGYGARTESLLSESLGSAVDAFYLCYEAERTIYRADLSQINIQTFHDDFIGKNGLATILETLISSTSGSCTGYRFEENSLQYNFEKPSIDIQSASLINFIQDSAIEFVSDFVTTFPEWEDLHYRFCDKPFRYYLEHASTYDKGIFSILKNHDPLFYIRDLLMIDLWPSAPCVGPAPVGVIGVKGALVNYFRKHMPEGFKPFAKRVKKMIKW